MLRSMYSGISGMKGFQTSLDTIGNNIANVNTTGYKKGRVSFQDMMSQTVSSAQGAIEGDDGNLRGGINPSQVGLGSQIGTIDNIHTQGNRQTTDRPLDLSLEGDGMFMLAEGTADTGIDTNEKAFDNIDELNTTFTRAGNFYLDNDGAIVNADGKYLVGESYGYNQNDNGDYLEENGNDVIQDDDNTNVTNEEDAMRITNPYSLQEPGVITIPESAQSFSIQTDGTVQFVNAQGNPQTAGQVRLANFSNPGGLEKLGSNTFQNTDNGGMMIDDAAGAGALEALGLFTAGESGTGQMVSGALEMSNVDLAESFTSMITAQRGFQANTRIITTSDEILQELVNLKR
ncbi:flagellar hook-basal body complex protein [Halobacillus seohaensis]|uniref:Flagellar hook protein FlgE n=1 Tax=Halobacillus seohaensis TaxID=447421 RepID=A0ABW2EK15_9BACI